MIESKRSLNDDVYIKLADGIQIQVLSKLKITKGIRVPKILIQ